MGKGRTTARKPTKTVSGGPLRRPINGMAFGRNTGVVPGVIVVKKGHGNKHIPRGIRRCLITTAGCSNKGWIGFYEENKDFLANLFGTKDNFIWMVKKNFKEVMEKLDNMKEKLPHTKRINI
jgi:hypothetical protein